MMMQGWFDTGAINNIFNEKKHQLLGATKITS